MRRMAATLFVVTAALFAVGVAAEGEEGSKDEAAEIAGGASEEGEEGHDESGEETVFGVDVESPATVTTAVLVSLALAAGLWVSTHRWIVLVAVAAGVVFAVFDAGEVARQLDESRSGGTALAGVVAAGHLAAAGAAWLSRRTSTT